jgi:hypothetical protein
MCVSVCALECSESGIPQPLKWIATDLTARVRFSATAWQFIFETAHRQSNVDYPAHKILTEDFVIFQLNPVRILSHCFFGIDCNIIQFTHRSPKSRLGFKIKILYVFLCLCMLYSPPISFFVIWSTIVVSDEEYTFLCFFPDFEKVKVGLWYHFAVCVSLYPPYQRLNAWPSLYETWYIYCHVYRD